MGRGLLALAIVFLVVVLAIAVSTPREPLGTGLVPLITGRLTEEYVPPQVIASSRTTLKPGTVWKVADSANGVEIVPVNTVLIERIRLSNITINSGDIVAPHLYDWFSAQDDDVADKILFNLKKPLIMPFNATFSASLVMPWSDWPAGWYTGVRLFNGTNGLADSGKLMIQGWSDCVELDVFNTTGAKFIVTTKPASTGEHIVSAHFENGNFAIRVDNVSSSVATTYSNLRNGVESAQVVVTDTASTGYTVFYHYAIIGNYVFDASFYNGSTYFDIYGDPGELFGTVKRVPAKTTWLWHVPGLENDGKLHVEWAPSGSILRIYYDGKTYEFRITGNTSIVQDYAVDLASVFGATTLPNASVELVYPSQKVRVYGPPGFTLRLVGEGWNETATIPDNASYVDFAVPGGDYSIELLGYIVTPGVDVSVNGDRVRITVTNENREALPGAKVYVYSGGDLVYTGITDDLGMVEFNKSGMDQARVIISYLDNGKYYHVDQVVSLEANYHIEPVTPTPTPGESLAAVERAQSGGGSSALIVLLIVLLAVAAAVLLRGR